MKLANKIRTLASRPRSSTKGPLDSDEAPLQSPLSPVSPQVARLSGQYAIRSRPSSSQARSPARPVSSSAATTPVIAATRDFSFLLKPEIYHQISPLTIPAPFRNPSRQPSPETPISELLAAGHFRAAAIAAVQALTSSPVSATQAAAHPPVEPADHARIFALLYTRLACLCLIGAVPLAAQEAKALEDLNSVSYLDPLSGRHLVPWELRLLCVRLQTIGFGDPRRAVMSYYDLAREARAEIARAGKARDHSALELWKARLAELGIKVAGALVEMDDLGGAAEHLRTLNTSSSGPDSGLRTRDSERLAMSRALLWLHLGDVDAARRCVGNGTAGETGERVIGALADMADGEYETALGKWRALYRDMQESGIQDEMVGVNLAVCMLYTGNMVEGRDILESLVDSGQAASHTLLFNLSTMYELCTDRAKNLKIRLAERVAERQPTAQGWEKTNADFKL
ncbi:hypothetical protein F4778DRAFT_770613 [Xylariomycetidae sp. FL2044]|nr:hypothetical protein F4778DRAFT_770613 [Xylariomycetidae sp. FL2044]